MESHSESRARLFVYFRVVPFGIPSVLYHLFDLDVVDLSIILLYEADCLLYFIRVSLFSL